MIATMRTLGQVMGIAVSGAILTTRMTYYAASTGGSQEQLFTLAQSEAFLAAAFFGLLGIITSLIRGKNA